MQFPAHIFRSYDIRGLLNEITPELVGAVARALVKKSAPKTVVIGRDMRKTSPELAGRAKEELRDAGVDVIDIGMCSKSMFNFVVTGDFGADAGIMITASHNPSQYNGIKVSLHSGDPITGTEMYDLVQHREQTPGANTKKGSVRQGDMLNAYSEKCVAWEGSEALRGMRIVVDYGNGMGALAFRVVCEKLGIIATELYAEPNADFPNHEANPANTETLRDLSCKVKEVHADFGVAFDGDADRIGFVDNEGNPTTGDMLLAALAVDILAQKQGTKFLLCVNQSWSTKDAIEQHGGEVVWSQIGWTKVSKLLRESGAALAGEYSGHIFFPNFSCLEAVDHAFVRIACAWKRSGKSFADFMLPYRTYARTGEMNFEIQQKQEAIEKLREIYGHQASEIKTIDGVRCEFGKEWWFLARPSNTEPVLRISIEAREEGVLKEKKEEIVALLRPFMHQG